MMPQSVLELATGNLTESMFFFDNLRILFFILIIIFSILSFSTGWPRLKWVVTDSKYLTKPSKDWQPHIPTANTDPAYIEVTAYSRCLAKNTQKKYIHF